MLIDTDVIDFISTNKNTQDVTLTISDELNWEDEEEHLTLLQEKLNSYLEFIETGQLFEEYPQAKGRNISIQVTAKYQVPQIGVDFYKKAVEYVQNEGYDLRYKVLKL